MYGGRTDKVPQELQLLPLDEEEEKRQMEGGERNAKLVQKTSTNCDIPPYSLVIHTSLAQVGPIAVTLIYQPH